MIKSWITQWRSNKAAFAPAKAFYAIGDIHGRFDLLTRLLDQLDPDVPLICVGDYVDRGEASADVLRFLLERPDIVCLKGNHEDMLLGFLDNPKRNGSQWLRYGGLQTLGSFGVSGITETAPEDDLKQASNALEVAMGAELISWLRALPMWHQSGNIFVCHAGADPHAALDDQQDRHMLWGHPDFAKKARSDGNWVLHGHTIVDNPTAQNTRISIDTGAFATGILTAALVHPGGVEFISA